MFWDDNWMSSLNQTINNLDGPLPFTPKYEFKLSGSYHIPKIEVDIGGRLRTASGRPLWKVETYPQLTQFGGPEDGIVGPGDSIVAVPSKIPTTCRRKRCSICTSRRRSSSTTRNGCSSSSMDSTCSTRLRPPTPIRTSSTER